MNQTLKALQNPFTEQDPLKIEGVISRTTEENTKKIRAAVRHATDALSKLDTQINLHGRNGYCDEEELEAIEKGLEAVALCIAEANMSYERLVAQNSKKRSLVET